MDQSPYCKYLSSSLTNKTSSLYLYYHEDAHQIIHNILDVLKSMPSRHARFILVQMLQYITDNTDLSV